MKGIFFTLIVVCTLSVTAQAAASVHHHLTAPGGCVSTYKTGEKTSTPGNAWAEWTANAPPAGCGNSMQVKATCLDEPTQRSKDYYSGHVVGVGIKDVAKCTSSFATLWKGAISINGGAWVNFYRLTVKQLNRILHR